MVKSANKKLKHYEFDKLLLDYCKQMSFKLACAESVTGGAIIAAFVKHEGYSDVITGGVVCYQNKVKTKALKVRNSTIKNHGAISLEATREMALGVKNLCLADVAIAISGNAGKKPQEKKPSGMAHVSIIVKELQFDYLIKTKFKSRIKIIDTMVKESSALAYYSLKL